MRLPAEIRDELGIVESYQVGEERDQREEVKATFDPGDRLSRPAEEPPPGKRRLGDRSSNRWFHGAPGMSGS
jgi:hypothetical protein